MFIYHFNRLIRNKILWTFFAIIIAFAFVSVDSCFKGTPANQTVAKLAGKPVSSEEFSQVESVLRKLSKREDISESALRERVWERIAAKRKAVELGLTVSVEEVKSRIEQEFGNAQGQFNFAQYQQLLAQYGFTTQEYEKMLRDELLIAKLADVVAASEWVSNMEVDEELAAMTDSFTIQYTEVTNTFVRKDMKLSAEAIAKYFDENKDAFALPDRIAVKYISLPITNHMEAAMARVDDTMIEEYYIDNQTEFTVRRTNETVTLPLTDVKDTIHKKLARQEAFFIAQTNANLGLVPQVLKSSFEDVATQLGAEIKLTPFFSEEKQPTIRDGKFIAEAAFDLDPTRPDSRLTAVKGNYEVFLIEYYTNSLAHMPELQEVERDVKLQAERKARADAFRGYLTNNVNTIKTALTKGETFEKAFAATEFKASATAPTGTTFSVMSIQSNDDLPYASEIIPAVVRLQKGELSEPLPLSTSDNALLVYLADRKAGDIVSSEMYRPRIQDQIVRRRMPGLFRAWSKWNLQQMKLTDNKLAEPAVTEDKPGTRASAASDEDDE